MSVKFSRVKQGALVGDINEEWGMQSGGFWPSNGWSATIVRSPHLATDGFFDFAFLIPHSSFSASCTVRKVAADD
jgi:hypothetical protein